jgi:hypothetical protein
MHKLYFITLSIFISIVCNSQKLTNTRLILPKDIVLKTLKILFDNGKKEEGIEYKDIDGY